MKNNNIVNLSLLMSSAIISIALAEVFLQIIGKPGPVISGWSAPKRNTSETNQLGFRGRDYNYTESDYVIILLGDSQVEASASSFDGLPERKLEYHLNQQVNNINKKIKVFSIGAGGYGQDQQLLLLEKYYQTFRADLVVLWQTPDNDIWNNVFPTHWPRNGWAKPTFRLVNGKLDGPSEIFGEELNWSKIKIFALANRLFQLSNRDGLWEKYLPSPYKPLSTYEGAICYDWQERWDENLGLMQNENLDTEKSHLAISLTPISPRMQYGLDLTRALLHTIEHLVKKNKGDFIIFNTQSSQSDEVEKNCLEDEVVHKLNGKYYKTSRKQFLDSLSYINAGFSSFTIPITISNWRVGPEDGHLNEFANDQVMKDLSTQIVSLIK
ncbi:MAG: hypothetical protein KF693_11345 [Nitrospira sp.]|nr:hypothetical protein [Nitrospira sp.]